MTQKNDVSKPAKNTIAYLSGKTISFMCKEPKCNGWNDCIATYNKKAHTLTVECSLCHGRTVKPF